MADALDYFFESMLKFLYKLLFRQRIHFINIFYRRSLMYGHTLRFFISLSTKNSIFLLKTDVN